MIDLEFSAPASAGGVRFGGMPGDSASVKLLFVCLGNICRSPTAEGVMRALVCDAGLERRIALDSAGTGDWHIGEEPDARATDAARRRGIELRGPARQVRRGDFQEFDLILAMDRSNLADLRRLAPDEAARAKVRLLREFEGRAGSQSSAGDLDVPDPYHGGARGFEHVLDLLQAACAALLGRLQAVDAAAAEDPPAGRLTAGGSATGAAAGGPTAGHAPGGSLAGHSGPESSPA
jgi:protein-tyrosine phosphatase